MSEDPLQYAGGQLNLFGYVGNSPANGTDPPGMAFCFYAFAGDAGVIPAVAIDVSHGVHALEVTANDSADIGGGAVFGGGGFHVSVGAPGAVGLNSLGIERGQIVLAQAALRCALSGNAPSPFQYQSLGHSANSVQNYLNLYEFHHGGTLDAQAYGGSQAYANYVFGVYMAAAGYSLSTALKNANRYASWFSHYSPKTPMDPKYPATPASNIANITEGFNDEKNAALCIIQ